MGKEIIPRVRRYKINTDEDWKVEIKIGIRKIGVNCGRDVMETVESVSLNAL